MSDTRTFSKVGIVGTGRVARALGSLLAAHSAEPAAVWGRTPAHRDSLVMALGSAQVAAQVGELAQACDLILIAVADDALAEVVAQLEAAMPVRSSAFIFHVSGRSGGSVLGSLEEHGALTAAIHPVMTFTGDAEADIRHVNGVHFAITASTSLAVAKATKLVDLLGGMAIEIAEEDRLLYHAALAHAANHLVTLMTQASLMLEAANIPEPRAVIASLVRAALENSIEQGFAALSGPLLRGDQQTIKGHLAALTAACPETLPAYRAMALATLEELEKEGKTVSADLKGMLE